MVIECDRGFVFGNRQVRSRNSFHCKSWKQAREMLRMPYLLDEITASKLLTSHMHGAVRAVTQEYTAFDRANDQSTVRAFIYHDLDKKQEGQIDISKEAIKVKCLMISIPGLCGRKDTLYSCRGCEQRRPFHRFTPAPSLTSHHSFTEICNQVC